MAYSVESGAQGLVQANYVLAEMVGKRVEIVKVRFMELQGHVAMIGKSGIVAKAIPSRNVYVIELAEGGRWEALPSNIKLAEVS